LAYACGFALGTVFTVQPLHALHIVGGEMSYVYLGGDEYEVTVVLYRDCNSGGADFDAFVELAAYSQGSTFPFSTTLISLTDQESIPIASADPCLVIPPSGCLEKGLYVATIELPAGLDFDLVWQRCCRGPQNDNLELPDTQGLSWILRVPDRSAVGDNSSPVFDTYPPVALCNLFPAVVDFSATDPDGDLLTYSLCAPFVGGSQLDPVPSPPAPPPYAEVDYAAGFSALSPLPANPPPVMDPSTGVLSFTPTAQGMYVIGAWVREFRNGQLLSESRRDIRFMVTACQGVQAVVADQDPTSACDGLTMEFDNLSVGGTSFLWDFGVPGTSLDVSTAEDPVFVFPYPGEFLVTLVVQPGEPCADTSSIVYTVFEELDVAFVPPVNVCVDEDFRLVAEGNYNADDHITWTFETDAIQPVLSGDTVAANISVPGIHTVTMLVVAGLCEASYTDSVRVYPRIVQGAVVGSGGCAPHAVAFMDTSFAETQLQSEWQFGDGAVEVGGEVDHTYQLPGLYSVQLTTTTTSGCRDTSVLVMNDAVRILLTPEAAFRVDPYTLAIPSNTEISVVDSSRNAVEWEYRIGNRFFTEPGFTTEIEDPGQIALSQVVTSADGCRDTAMLNVVVEGHYVYAPSSFTPNGDGLNDVWYPSVLGARQYALNIYDRWGTLWFSTIDPAQGWNGGDMPSGIYPYRIELIDWGVDPRTYDGHIMLIR
jgi:gliding motility-associated-like protein